MQERVIVVLGKVRKVGCSDYLLLPKSEFKRVNHNMIYRFEIKISEVEECLKG